MKYLFVIILLVAMLVIPVSRSVSAQDGCASAFDDVRAFTAEAFERMSVADDGTITWEATDWENIVRRMVATSEFYLNTCMDSTLPLEDQTEAIARFAELSLLPSPVESLNVGGDFGEVMLASDFVPQTAWIDLNGDGVNELLLHTQVPYFSEKNAYLLRGGLSIAFFNSEDGWQGQVIAPVTNFVTDESGDHLSYAMVEDNTLSAESAGEALAYFPGPMVEVLPLEGDSPLTAISLTASTNTGEAKELAILSWDGRIPSVELRVAFNDWCYPGDTLEWEIREDGSVFVPSNGAEEGFALHCGRTPEVLFEWQDGKYVVQGE